MKKVYLKKDTGLFCRRFPLFDVRNFQKKTTIADA